ncbi:hypothetical protein ACP4OV_010753 [Aristida adscensionis]
MPPVAAILVVCLFLFIIAVVPVYDCITERREERERLQRRVLEADDRRRHQEAALQRRQQTAVRALQRQIEMIGGVVRAGTDEQERGDLCVICLDPIDADEELRVLPCRHAFHRQCVDKWFAIGNLVCPICKFEVAPELDAEAEAEAAPEP